MPTLVVQANIEVHTRMADSYNRNEPHFRPENQEKVREILQGPAGAMRWREAPRPRLRYRLHHQSRQGPFR